MKGRIGFASLLGALGCGGALSAQLDQGRLRSRGRGGIEPKLENVASDKGFFGPPFPADYPHDSQPEFEDKDVRPKRSGIYPKVQQDGFLDHDYVKDDNSDGGEWKAQMAYDRARVRLAKDEEERRRAQARAEEKAKDADAAKKKLEDADKERKDAAKDAEDADGNAGKKEKEKDDADAAKKKADDDEKKAKEDEQKNKENSANATVTKEALEKELKEAQDDFEKAEEGLKECQDKYDKAKAELEKVKKQASAFEKAAGQKLNIAKVNNTQFVANATDQLKVATAKLSAARAQSLAAKAKAAAAAENQNKAKAEVRWRQAASERATEDLDKVMIEFNAAKEVMESSKASLKRIRGGGSNGEAAASTQPTQGVIGAFFHRMAAAVGIA